MNFAMTSSMVAPINMGKQLLGNWCSAKKNIVEINNTNRRFSLLGSACSHCSPVAVKMMNGLKDVPLINGTEDFATFLRGSFVEGRFVYRQNFFVRSYETGPDKTISMETLTNFLQVSIFASLNL